MADVKTADSGMPGWVPWAGLVLALATIVFLYAAIGSLVHNPGTNLQGAYSPQRQAEQSVLYGGHRWVPADATQAASLPEGAVTPVGTDNGITIYGTAGGGGGAGQPAQKLYVRTTDGKYLPLVKQ
jgi:hypothetical protein